MSEVKLDGVGKTYGSVVALHEVDLSIREGEFLTLLGPSGCGKTTTLRLVAGFIEPSSGRILLGGDDVTWLPPHRREIGMVFQDYALFPHLRVRDNIVFGLKERGAGKADMTRRAKELLELIRLPDIADRFPSELSGGQAQRVAFARAIAHPPRVLLMDEPLGALDLKLREAMQIELSRLQRALGITTIFVTHDQGEAMSMSDRIAVMNKGRIEQIGTAEQIYEEPRTRFVASFVGQINLVDGTIASASAGSATVSVAPGHSFRTRCLGTHAAGSACAIAIRPEKLRLLETADTGLNAIEGQVTARTFVGSSAKLTVDIGSERTLVLEDRPQVLDVAPGTKVRVGWAPDDGLLLTD